jgi:FMN phosphatase YigB (HAD superfamily)
MSKIKVIIFDFDGTLYCGEDFKYFPYYNKNAVESILDSEKLKLFSEKYKDYYKQPNHKVAELLEKEFGMAKDFVSYERTHLYPLDLENITHINWDFLYELAQKIPLVIVSNSKLEHQKFYLNQFGLDLNIFSDFYENTFDTENGKGDYYAEVIKKYNCRAEEVLVIGDNYEPDILPAIKLGMVAYHIKNINQVKDVIEKVLSNN